MSISVQEALALRNKEKQQKNTQSESVAKALAARRERLAAKETEDMVAAVSPYVGEYGPIPTKNSGLMTSKLPIGNDTIFGTKRNASVPSKGTEVVAPRIDSVVQSEEFGVPANAAGGELIVRSFNRFLEDQYKRISEIDSAADGIDKNINYRKALKDAAEKIGMYRRTFANSSKTLDTDTAAGGLALLSELEEVYRERMSASALPKGYLDAVSSGSKTPAADYIEKTGGWDATDAQAASVRDMLDTEIKLSDKKQAERSKRAVNVLDKNRQIISDIASGDTTYLKDNELVEMSLEDIEKRRGEIEAELSEYDAKISSIQKEIKDISGFLDINLAMSPNAGTNKKRVDELKSEISVLQTERDKLERTYDRYAERYYEVENEEAAKRIKADRFASASYESAVKAERGIQAITDIFEGIVNGTSTKSAEAEKYIEETYGIGRDGRNGISYENDLRDLQSSIEFLLDLQKKDLSSRGYDYDRMKEYTRRQEAAAKNEAEDAESTEYAKQHPLLSTIDTVATSPVKGIEYLGFILDNIGNGNKSSELAEYTPLDTSGMEVTRYTDLVRSVVKSGITQKLGDGAAGNIAAFLYDAGVSSAESLYRVLALGGGTASLLFAAGGAAADKTKSAAENGGSFDEAVFSGLAAGAAEMIFEKVSLDKLLENSNPKTIRQLLVNTLKQSGVEASEEMFTEIANIISDSLILGKYSDSSIAISNYLDAGMSYDDAKKQAMIDLVGQVAVSGLAGAVSGGMTNTLMSGINAAQMLSDKIKANKNKAAVAKNRYGAVQSELVEEGLESAEGTKSRKLAEKYSRILENGGDLTGTQLAALVEANEEAFAGEETAEIESERQYKFDGYAKDGRGMYTSNFPKGTPKAAKSERILNYIQNVWSKNPISLKITDENGNAKTILAEFDPTYVDDSETRTDATKLMGGNRHGTSAEQRVTLDLADDYYQLLEESTYNYSRDETGKDTSTHEGVTQWHYFVNDILFAEHGSDKYTPYRVSINIKEKPDGNFVYSYSAEKEEGSTAQRTLHAAVSHDDNVITNDQPSDNSISHPDGSVNTPYYSDSVVTSPAERVADVRASAEENDISAEDIAAFERAAEEFGVSVQFYDGDPDVDGDGYYENGTIYLNRNARDPIAVVFSHELAHAAERAGYYKQLQSLALREMQRITGKDLSALRAEVTELYARHGKKLSTGGADAEIVARFIQEHVLGNTEELGRLCAENPSLMQRILDYFTEFLEKIGIINEDTRRIDRARRTLAGALRDAQRTNISKSGKADTRHSFSRSAGSLDADSVAEAERMESEGYTEDEIYDAVGMWKDSETGRWMRDSDSVSGDTRFAPYAGRLSDTEYAEKSAGFYEDQVDVYRDAVHEDEDVAKVESTKKEVTDAVETLLSMPESIFDSSISEMSDDERAEMIRNTEITVAGFPYSKAKFSGTDIERMQKTYKSEADKYLKTLGDKLGVFGDYQSGGIEFKYSRSSMGESIHKQNERTADFYSFAKMLYSFDSVVKNAKLIESHSDKYAGTDRSDSNLENVYVLLSAFKDGDYVIPVELQVKEFKDGTKNKLYLTVTLQKIEADLMAAPRNTNGSANTAKSTSVYSLHDIIKNVNPSDSDFLKYVPDELLSDAQLKGKAEAVARERERLSKMREKHVERQKKRKKTSPKEKEPASASMVPFSKSYLLKASLGEVDTSSLSARELEAVTAFREKLSELEHLEEERKSLGSQWHTAQFEHGNTGMAQHLLKRMKALDAEIAKVRSELLSDSEKRALREIFADEHKADLLEERQRGEKKIENLKEKHKESQKKSKEKRDRTELVNKIKNLKERLEKTLTNPTERAYVPAALFETMAEICDLIKDDTPLYKKNGEINKTQWKREKRGELLHRLAEQYKDLDGEGSEYGAEFEGEINETLQYLAKRFNGESIQEMSLTELHDFYDVLRSIEGTLSEARFLLGQEESITVMDAGWDIIDEQHEITAKRRKGGRNAAELARDSLMNNSLNPMRLVERVVGYNTDSRLMRLMSDFEKGVRTQNFFVMNSRKRFEELATGKNKKLYDGARYDDLDLELTDIYGRKFKISKMMAMQAVMSYERELSERVETVLPDGKLEMGSTRHIHEKGYGLTFPDLKKMRQGKFEEAISEEYSHRVTGEAAVSLVEFLKEELAKDTWATDFMNTAWDYFNTDSKEAINDTMLKLKHRIVARESKYIPFETDSNFVVREISADFDVQEIISSFGFLKSRQNYASNPLIIMGLDNVLERHIQKVGTLKGLAIPVRNFNKVWNGQRQADHTSVRAAIERNWGKEGKELIESTVRDLQSARKQNNDAFHKAYRWVKRNRIQATFTPNLSVVSKQIASMFSATSMIEYRDPVKMLANLIYTAGNSKKISAEVDKYTAAVWMRRQGLSDTELYTLKTSKKKGVIGKLLDKLPTPVNPVKWVSGMDSLVALSLWKYCKEDVSKRTGLKGEELLKATAEFFDSVIENTQSMSDVLHKSEFQKSDDNIFANALTMFKTDLFQMSGQVSTAAGRFKANPTKENAKALGKSLFACAQSSLWAACMTALFAFIRYRDDDYRDEKGELTFESIISEIFGDMVLDIGGYAVPLFGSETIGSVINGAKEAVEGAENNGFVGAVFGFGNGVLEGEYGGDTVSDMVIDAINDCVDSINRISAKLSEGKDIEVSDYISTAADAIELLTGAGAGNIERIVTAGINHYKDIINGEFGTGKANDTDSKDDRNKALIGELVNTGLGTDEAADIVELMDDLGGRKDSTTDDDEEYTFTGDGYADLNALLFSNDTDEDEPTAKEEALAAMKDLGLTSEQEYLIYREKIASPKEVTLLDAIDYTGGDPVTSASVLMGIRECDNAGDKLQYLMDSPIDDTDAAMVFYGMLASEKERAAFDMLRDGQMEKSEDIFLTLANQKRIENTPADDLKSDGYTTKGAARYECLQESPISESSKSAYYYEHLATETDKDTLDELDKLGSDMSKLYRVVADVRFAENKGKQYGILIDSNITGDEQYAILKYKITSKNNREDLDKDIEDVEAVGGTVDDYLAAKEAVFGLESDRDWKGKTIKNSLSKKKLKAIRKALPGTNYRLLVILFEICGVSKDVY